VVHVHDGEIGSSLNLSSSVWDAPCRLDIVHRVVEWQRNKRRHTLYKGKKRGEVRGGGRKPWK